jgi:hypothetical protein
VTKPFHVTLIQPAGYVHALALAEVVEYVAALLGAAGYAVQRAVNRIAPDAHNVIACGHLLTNEQVAALPADTIAINCEPLADPGAWHFASGAYRRLLAACHVWDASLANLPLVGHERTAFLPLRHCAALVRPLARAPGDAVVFYGSLTPRRTELLRELRVAGVAVRVLHGRYGEARDRELVRARAVLNLHQADATHIFEAVRCFYPLCNRIPVISEELAGDPTLDAYRDAAFFVPRAAFARDVAALLARDDFAARAEAQADHFARTDATAAIASAAARFLASVPVST